MAMDTNGAPANPVDSLFGSDPTPAAPPVAVPASPELAPANPPISPDPNSPVDPSQLTPAPAAQPPAQPDHRVPLSELLETRHRAQSAEARAREAEARVIESERRMQQFVMEALQRQQYAQQPQPQPIDPIAEPERAYQALMQRNAELEHHVRALPQQILQQVHQDTLNERLNASEHAARRQHGDDLVTRARDAALQAGMAQVFRQQPDPYGALVQWYRTQEFAQRVGTDPAAYEAQIRQEERERLMAELRQGRQPSNIPPSITAATNSATAPSPVGSDKDFFNSMFARRTTKPG